MLHLSERQKELVTGFLIIGIMVGGWGVGEALLRLVQRGQFGTAVDMERSVQFYRDQQTGLRLPVPNATQGKCPTSKGLLRADVGGSKYGRLRQPATCVDGSGTCS